MARAVANGIKIRLCPDEAARLPTARPVNPEAHEAYLKGVHYQQKPTEEALRSSLKYFEEAIRRDPNFALAFLGLSVSYVYFAYLQFLPHDEVIAKLKAAALELLRRNSRDAAAVVGAFMDNELDRAAPDHKPIAQSLGKRAALRYLLHVRVRTQIVAESPTIGPESCRELAFGLM